jgi:flagellar biosynthetic protein FliQ
MTADQAVGLMANLLQVTAFVVGPLLLAALLSGVGVGILQTATQINEASISFLVKVATVIVVIVVLGPRLSTFAIEYARQDLTAIAQIVH